MAAFGWSVGDIVASIRIAADVAKAFKETGGASSRYKQSQDFLTGFRITLEHLKKYAEENPNDTYVSDLNDQLARIEPPWKDFKVFVDKYEKSLDEASQRPKVLKTPRIVKWTIKDLTGEVEKLERAITKSVQVINSLLSLQSLKNIAGLPDKLLSSAQFTQLLDDTNLTQLSSDMDSRIARLEQVISQRLDTEREDTRERELKNLQEMSQCMEQFRTEMLEDAAHGRRVSWTDTENFTQKITENLERRYERFSQIETEKTIEAQQAMITTMQIALEAKIEALRDDVTRAHEHMSADSRGTNAPVEVLSTTQWTGIIFLCLGSAIATSAGILEWSRIGKKMPYTSLMLKKQTGEPFYRNLIQNSGGYKSSRSKSARTTADAESSLWINEFYQRRLSESARLPARSVNSSSSSMTPVYLHQPQASIASDPVPSLCSYGGSSAGASDTSISTGLASRPSEVTLLQEVNGTLQRPPPITPVFSCTFWYLPCDYVSFDMEEWKTHCLAHFRARPPPCKMECPCCLQFTSMQDNGYDTMSRYLEHMADHLLRGENPKYFSVRKEQHLYLYLWQQHIISSEIYEWLRSGNKSPYTKFIGKFSGRNYKDTHRLDMPTAVPETFFSYRNNDHDNDRSNDHNNDGDNDQDEEDSDADTIAAPSDQQSDFGDAEKEDKDADEKKDNAGSKPFKRPRYFLPSKLEFASMKNSVIRGDHVQHKVAIYVDHLSNELPMEWSTEMETEYEMAV